MKISVNTLAVAAGSAMAQQVPYGQCGGANWDGPTTCESGWTCVDYNPYYSQCVQVQGSVGTSAVSTSIVNASSAVGATTVAQCTTAWTTIVISATPTTPSSTVVLTTSPTSDAQTSAVPTTTSPPASSTAPSSTSTPVAVSTASASATSSSNGTVSFAGINISGFDFGCSTDGDCDTSSTEPPGQVGIDQIQHFVSNDGLNAFRLPVGWQYLVNNDLGGDLDASNFANYSSLVNGCLDAGAEMCIIDIHNYARWNGGVIGQGGPTNEEFTSVWSQLATAFANESRVTFAIMNEPYSLDLTLWAETCQAVVTAIRATGATSQKILVPGNNYTSALTFVSDDSATVMSTVIDSDGTTDKLIFDVHAYLDEGNSGTSSTCVTNNSANFITLGDWLRSNGRQAMLTETGGGPDEESCLEYVCQELDTLISYSDVFLGWTGWAAGSFSTSYTLSEVPTESDGTWTNVELVTQCIAGKFKSSG